MGHSGVLSSLNSRGYGSNKGTAEWAMGPELYTMIRSETVYAQKVAQSLIAKDTGNLSRSAEAKVEPYSGSTLTAWQGYVETNAVHPRDPTQSYAAAHEFGWYGSDGNHHPGGHELEMTLARIG